MQFQVHVNSVWYPVCWHFHQLFHLQKLQTVRNKSFSYGYYNLRYLRWHSNHSFCRERCPVASPSPLLTTLFEIKIIPRQLWMLGLVGTPNTWMIYKITNAKPTFCVIVQVQYLAETERRLVFETLWIFTQPAVVTCSGSSCQTLAWPAQLAQWPLPLYSSHTAQCPRWGTSAPGSCLHSSYAL
jgi:hypothetical protein